MHAKTHEEQDRVNGELDGLTIHRSGSNPVRLRGWWNPSIYFYPLPCNCARERTPVGCLAQGGMPTPFCSILRGCEIDGYR